MSATLRDWKIYIIEPEAATNLCANPSVETAVAGYYSGTNCTVTQSSEQARRGKYSAKGVPTGLDTSAYIYTTVVATAVSHTFSVDLYGVAGVNYTVQIQNTGGTVIASTAVIGNGHWQRVSVTGTLTAASYNFIVERNASQNTTAAFYADGWLVKVGSDNNYFDGDSVDRHLDTPQFYWTGTPHASTSVRLATTRAGGTLLDLDDYCRVRFINGLGLTGMITNTSGLALGGELYQNTHANSRVFQLICQSSISSTAAYGTLQRKLARLEKALNPKRMKTDQPLRMMIVGLDSAGTEASDRVIIECAYEGGLEGALTSRVLDYALTFRQFDPTIKADGMIVTSLSPSTTEPSGEYGSVLMVSDDTGTTTRIAAGSSPGDYVKDVVFDDNGGIYFIGYFEDWGGANGDGIVYRNSAGTISSLGSGAADSAEAGMICSDGKLYLVGSDPNIGGVAAADFIGRWTGSAWEAVGSSGLNGSAYCITEDSEGNIYVGGAFTTAGGVTVNRFAKHTISSGDWAALGSGTVGFSGGSVWSMVCLPDNKIIMGGDMANGGGEAAYDYLVTWDGTSYGQLETAPNGSIKKLIYDKKAGILYAFGAFTEIGGVAANYAAYWDGSNWNPMPGATSIIYYATLTPYGVQANSTFPALQLSNRFAYWDGATWRANEIGCNKGMIGIFYRNLTREYLVSTTYNAGDAIAWTFPAVSAITNSTEGDIYPSLTLDATGYYIHSLWNRTTGDRIYLNGLKVGLGEKIELVFSPTGYTITSNLRGDMRSSVLSGSSPTFHLQPGANYVSCFVYPSPTAAVTIPLKYPPAGYISLNETVYE